MTHDIIIMNNNWIKNSYFIMILTLFSFLQNFERTMASANMPMQI